MRNKRITQLTFPLLGFPIPVRLCDSRIAIFRDRHFKLSVSDIRGSRYMPSPIFTENMAGEVPAFFTKPVCAAAKRLGELTIARQESELRVAQIGLTGIVLRSRVESSDKRDLYTA